MSSSLHTKYHYNQGRISLWYLWRHTELMLVGLAMQRIIFFRSAATALLKQQPFSSSKVAIGVKSAAKSVFTMRKRLSCSLLSFSSFSFPKSCKHTLWALCHSFAIASSVPEDFLGKKNLAFTLCFRTGCYLCFHPKPYLWTKGTAGDQNFTTGYLLSPGRAGI